MKLPTRLICIDIETTDLDGKIGSVIQLSALAFDEDFKEVDSFDMYIKPLTTWRHPNAMAINKISEETLQYAMSLPEILDLFENFVQIEKTPVLLSSWGAYFDIPFLKEQYSKLNRKWPFNYKSIDLKSIAIWEFAKRGVPFPGGVEKGLQYLNLEFEGRKHDALSDIRNTLRILKKFESQELGKTGW